MFTKQAELSSELNEKIKVLATNSDIDPTMAAIIQSIALIVSNSTAAQLESNKLQRSMAEASKTTELRDLQKLQKKEDAKLSSGWDKLDETVKSTILTASSDGASIPKKPSESFVKMVQAKTGMVIRLRIK